MNWTTSNEDVSILQIKWKSKKEQQEICRENNFAITNKKMKKK